MSRLTNDQRAEGRSLHDAERRARGVWVNRARREWRCWAQRKGPALLADSEALAESEAECERLRELLERAAHALDSCDLQDEERLKIIREIDGTAG